MCVDANVSDIDVDEVALAAAHSITEISAVKTTQEVKKGGRFAMTLLISSKVSLLYGLRVALHQTRHFATKYAAQNIKRPLQQVNQCHLSHE